MKPLRYIPVLFLLCLLRSTAGGQASRTIDSLENLLATAPSDSLKIGLMNELSSEWVKTKPWIALEYGEKALVLAEQRADDEGRALALAHIGAAAYVEGDYAKELECYLAALRIRETLGDSAEIANALNRVGNVHFTLNNRAKSLEFYRRSMNIRKAIGDSLGYAGSLNNIGIIQYRQKDLDSALYYYSEALNLNRKLGNVRSEAVNLRNIGLIHEDRKNYALALNFYLQALELRKKLGDKSAIAGSYNTIGTVYTFQKNWRKGIEFHELALKTAEEIGGKRWMRDACAGLSKTYEDMGNTKLALDYYKKYADLKDTLYSAESSRKIADAQGRFEAEKRNKEIQLQALEREKQNEAELNRQKIIRNYIAAGFIVLLVLAFVLVYQYRLKQKANHLLESKVLERTQALTRSNEALEKEVEERKKTEESLKNANQELNTFIYQSSHDLRSPITSIQGLLNIAKAESRETSAHRYLELMDKKLEHLAKTHANLINMMEIREGAEQIGPIDFEEVFENVQSGLQNIPGFDTLKFSLENALQQEFRSASGVIGSILQHLLTNAIHFQDKDKESYCTIRVQNTENGISMTVKDNGVGMAEEVRPKVFDMFFRGSYLARGSGLGLYIVKIAVERLKGSIRLGSREGEGTVVVVELPAAA